PVRGGPGPAGDPALAAGPLGLVRGRVDRVDPRLALRDCTLQPELSPRMGAKGRSQGRQPLGIEYEQIRIIIYCLPRAPPPPRAQPGVAAALGEVNSADWVASRGPGADAPGYDRSPQWDSGNRLCKGDLHTWGGSSPDWMRPGSSARRGKGS